MNRKISKSDLTPWPPTPMAIEMMKVKHGRLAILGSAGRDKRGAYFLECLCDCGVVAIIGMAKIKSGHSGSCGCLHLEKQTKAVTKHGDSNWAGRKAESHIIYSKWQSVKARCLYKTTPSYPRYGGRGITICDGYRYNYEFFKADLGEQPSKEHSVDRVNPNLSYSCGKCDHCNENGWPMNIRWANQETQANNKCNSIVLFYNGERITASQAQRKYGIHRTVIRKRISDGWSAEDILTTPPTRRNIIGKLNHLGNVVSMYKSIPEAALKNKMSKDFLLSELGRNDGNLNFKYL
jgi:hypothetical protein